MTTGRIASTQVRTTAPHAEKPAARAETKPAAKAAVNGWGAGAKPVTSLKITAASIGDGPALTPKLQVPKGYTAELKNLSNKASDTVHGTKVSVEVSEQQATVTTPAGKKVQLGNKPDLTGLVSEWKAAVKDAKGQPPAEFMALDWESGHTFAGVGTAGKLMSVSESFEDYTGGAHPNAGSALATYDASTGKKVTLDSLLTPQQMSNLVKDVTAKLARLKGPEGIDGSSFGMGDAKTTRDTINQNFAVTTDKQGKVHLQIGWESGVHALGGLMASFTVDAPNDAAFRARVGLPPSSPPPAR
jgi:hypothetical protein